MIRARFWEKYQLKDLTTEEWESLCDRCGRCCLVKLQDEETDEVHYTSISCELLDPETCQCTDYSNRQQRVPGCIKLSPMSREELDYLPPTCAYVKMDKGEPLESWHPLVSGDPNSVHKEGISVAYKVFPEHKVVIDDIQDFAIEFDDYEDDEENS